MDARALCWANEGVFMAASCATGAVRRCCDSEYHMMITGATIATMQNTMTSLMTEVRVQRPVVRQCLASSNTKDAT